MKTLWADFNAQDADGAVRLNTQGSQRSLQATPSCAGEHVYLSDGEIRVVALLRARGAILVAIPEWETARAQ